ncbi:MULTISPECIES: DNA cytosine methyltransferase [Stenotrophomonas]|uniref:Cytosine-specific methyltransferase n=1 Tax=Stenotrophomonas maltophilia TaxID=40324 RepID=A0A2J0UI58_STEMA|nr:MULTISPECIES: DNA cytosine methyltransferase [Stenotrophomonas]PJL34548.1 DNA (cytosine-5-)-methyltransferase [Stenotrophomonas maltophilia]HDS1146950.1 DNA cytosine methyltransferase [Stenotrophomonas maltophilia]HDS1159633.1 DNA cytosine methyltransferase [Stenotrophomonas maltophilia]
MEISCVDLFCGAGGLTHGLRAAGIEVEAGVDLDLACEYPYEINNQGSKFIAANVEELKGRDVVGLFRPGAYSLLAGCAPCQPFSSYSQGRDTTGDRKWGLLRSFGRLVRSVKPDFVTMENVPQLPGHSVFDDFLKAFKGYSVWFDVVNCQDYGVPQSRRRLVLLASKHGKIEMPLPTHSKHEQRTVRDAIGNLPSLRAGAMCEADSMHQSATLSSLNLKRIRQSVPGGTWRDWDQSLLADCHRRDSGKTYPGVYARMEWDKPAPTMTTLCYGYGNGRFGHPIDDRAISLREAALLQTFPGSYKFAPDTEKNNFRVLGRLIGNAVPVRLGEVIGGAIVRHARSLAN